MDSLTSSNTPSSSSSSSVFTSNKKKNRIDSVALALANRMSSSLAAAPSFPFVNTNPGPSTVEAQISQCSVCRQSLNDTTTAKTCPICKRHMHVECVGSNSALVSSFLETIKACAVCCAKSSFSSLIANDALLSSSSVAADKDVPPPSVDDAATMTTFDDHSMVRSQSLGAIDKQQSGQCQVNSSIGNTFCAISSAVSLEEVVEFGTTTKHQQFPGFTSSPPASSGTPTSRSSTPLFPQDGECSDNDEYHPPGTIVRRIESTRGSRGKGRKPTSATLQRQSSTAMRTRSFGKPPSSTAVSYAATFDLHFKAEEKPGGKKSRGNASKGKGGNRGRRPTGGGGGRGSKLVSMYANALTTAAAATATASRREHSSATVDERRKEEEGGTGTTTDKEYIRTCVVTSREDKFMTEVSMCLVCGSIGRGAEGSMITCLCCAQSFHTYCVLMHDKLNSTVMQRGWRCLDCTVCEGCGSGEDEPNLLLCDECDISYHTYCLKPPLKCIPRGSWRCKWCATCSRCGAQIKSGADLQRLDGFCEACYSLRKCLKCQAPYEIGDLMLKCGRCLRWLHARCEGLTTEEQAENAAENAFRCFFCRPQIFQDALNVPVMVDNVMISKSAVDQIQSNIRKLTGLVNLGEHIGNISRSISYEQDDLDLNDELQEQLIASVFAGRGRGCAVSGGGAGRGGGPGRRMLKIGVGGFNVRTPKSRLPFLTGGSANVNSTPMHSNEEEQQMLEEDGLSPLMGPNGKPRIRRPRKLKRPLLEDAYPPQIQESFFGVAAVDSRTLAEQTVDEPILNDYKKAFPVVNCTKLTSELSEYSAELLRTEQEMDMLGDIPLVDNIMDGLDMEGLDFSDLIVGEEEDEPMTVESSTNTMDPINEGYNAGSSSNLVAHSVVSEVFSPSSCSSIRTPSRVLETGPTMTPAQPSTVTAAASAVFLQNNTSLPIGQQPQLVVDQQQPKQSATAITTERWEEDEPLGDKATKAAVLYANVHHAYLKEKFPVWMDRVRQINRVWRELNADRRQEFVEWARKNRANCPTIRRRGRRTISSESVKQQQNIINMGQQQNAIQNQLQPTTSRTVITTPVLVGQQQEIPFRNVAAANNIIGKTKAMGIVLKQEQQQLEPMLHHQQQQQVQQQQVEQKQVKGTRGRKRKKPLSENVRASVLGGVPFASLTLQIDRDVFDTVDALIGFVATSMDNSGNSGVVPVDDTLLVQKILSQQQNNDTNAADAAQRQLGVGKTKKRRQTQTKARSNQPDVTNELELIQERIKKSVELIPPITNYMEQYQANDKQMMKYPDQSALPDHEGSEPPLHGNTTGEYTLPFMPDYYNELETVREYVDEENLLPPTMGEICWDVNFDALTKDLDDPSSSANGEESADVKDFLLGECHSVRDAGTDDDETLLNFLSIDQIGNRSKIVKSLTLLGAQGPSQEAPLEPHWSRFDEEPRDLDRTVEVVLTVDPSLMPRDEFVDSLCQILGISSIEDITELDTPPYTPDSPRNGGTVQYHHQSILEDDNSNNQQHNHQSLKKENGEAPTEMAIMNNIGPMDRIICKNCNSFIPPGKTPIDDTHGRLGLLSESKEEKMYFCSMHCYYKFLALYRIPLNVESLEMAERYVDNVTLETLRQISADTFAKRINAGLPPHSMFLGEQQQHSTAVSTLATAEGSSTTAATTNTTSAFTFDSGVAAAQREFLIKTSELPALLMVQQNMEKKRAVQALQEGGFRWRGFGWNICDTTLVQSFKRKCDDAKQQFAAIHSQTNDKRVNWSDDLRQCSFCEQIGDGDQRLTGRLLNVDANKWVHVNCALWSAEVHVAEDGGLINVEAALRRAKVTECRLCGHKGASIRCYKLDCANNELAFHLICAKQLHGHFVKDKTFFCAEHDIHPEAVVTDLSALRRLFVQRDENQLLSKIFNHSYRTEMVMRVGSLIFHRIGQLLPDQLKTFTTDEHIFPVGYRVTRLFWSSYDITDRVRYECAVVDDDGKPEFCVKNVDHEAEAATTAAADGVQQPQREQRGNSPTASWTRILHAIADFRTNSSSAVLRFFPRQMSGEYLFGFLEPSISKMLESLPGIDQLYTYTFKHGGTPLMDLPLAENPSGCARCEPCFRTLVKQRHRPIISNSPKKSMVSSTAVIGSDAVVTREGRSTRNNSARFLLAAKFDQEMLRAYKASGISERMLFQTPYLRSSDMAQLVVQYREMKRECKSNVYLGRSKIQGMGLYAKRDLDMNQMIIEYIGELVRSEVCEIRQTRYIEQNRGEYMFRIDCDWVVDATMAGGLARYINHSCDPNCGTKILPVNDEKKVVIFANRPIKAGEELTYDYQFDIEETGKKIPCLCGAPNCVKWMN